MLRTLLKFMSRWCPRFLKLQGDPAVLRATVNGEDTMHSNCFVHNWQSTNTLFLLLPELYVHGALHLILGSILNVFNFLIWHITRENTDAHENGRHPETPHMAFESVGGQHALVSPCWLSVTPYRGPHMSKITQTRGDACFSIPRQLLYLRCAKK
jgi:hypothetical protein